MYISATKFSIHGSEAVIICKIEQQILSVFDGCVHVRIIKTDDEREGCKTFGAEYSEYILQQSFFHRAVVAHESRKLR
jgi:hypothetical protein